MTNQEDFIAAICAAPRDDLLRVVYADWLNDHGDADRAEFIRVQVRLAELGEEVKALGMYGTALLDLSALAYWQGWPITPEQRARCEEALALMRRERELLAGGNAAVWAGPCVVILPTGESVSPYIRFTRGFVSSLTSPWPPIRDHIDAIRKTHPIEKVVLTTDPDVGWRSVDREATVQGLWLVNAAGEPIGDDMEFGHEENPYPALLAAWQPGIEWELPPTNPYEGLVSVRVTRFMPEPTRDRIEAVVRREMPAGERVEWLATPSPYTTEGRPYYRIHHNCPNDNAAPFLVGGPPPEEYPTQVFRTVELSLREWYPTSNRDPVTLYRGRCERCRTTYLAPQR